MVEKHPLSLSSIFEFFSQHKSQLERGEKAYQSGNVIHMICDFAILLTVIRGTVSASMKKRSYSVEMIVSSDKKISSMSCTCPRGQDVCHHMATLALYAHYNVSTTDMSCTWNRQNAPEETEDITELYLSTYNALQEPIPANTLQDFTDALQQCHAVGFSWLLKPNPAPQEVISNILPQIETVITSN